MVTSNVFIHIAFFIYAQYVYFSLIYGSFSSFNHQDDTQSAASRWESLIAVQESTSVSDWMHAGMNTHTRKKCPNLKR